LRIESPGSTAGVTFAERGAVEAVITERGAPRTDRAAVVR
jgi:hypothetical protein